MSIRYYTTLQWRTDDEKLLDAKRIGAVISDLSNNAARQAGENMAKQEFGTFDTSLGKEGKWAYDEQKSYFTKNPNGLLTMMGGLKQHPQQQIWSKSA